MHRPTIIACLLLCLSSLIIAQTAEVAEHVTQLNGDQFVEWVQRTVPSNILLANTSIGMEAMKSAKKIVDEHGCATNVCFAFDGGAFVTKREYQIEVDFAALVAAVAGLDDRFFASSVQYGLTHTRISRRTADIDAFLLDIENSSTTGPLSSKERRNLPTWRNSSRESFRKSLRFCKRQASATGPSADKIIFLTDLRSPRSGVRISTRFRDSGGSVCAIAFGSRRRPARLERWTNDARAVLGAEQYDDALDLLEEAVMNACGVKS